MFLQTNTHPVVSAGDAAEEHKVGDEETHAQMEVDAVACSLYGAAEAEGQNTQKQTDQRQNQAHASDHHQPERVLEEQTERDDG